MARRYPDMSDEQYSDWKHKLSIAHKNKPSWNKGKNLTTLCIPCHASIEFYLKKALLRVGGEEVETE